MGKSGSTQRLRMVVEALESLTILNLPFFLKVLHPAMSVLILFLVSKEAKHIFLSAMFPARRPVVTIPLVSRAQPHPEIATARVDRQKGSPMGGICRTVTGIFKSS